jgi:hypothetical protein
MNHKDYTWKPSEDKNGFLRFDIPKKWDSHTGGYWNFNEGEIRESIKRIYDKDSNYVLLNVAANPLAANELSKYVRISKRKPEFDYEIRKRKRLEDEDGAMDFRPDLMGTYLQTLNELNNLYLGKKNYAFFPLVNGKTHEILESVNWPVVYVLRDNGTSSSQFRDLVSKLNNDESYEIIKKIEGMWKYRLGHAEVLRDKKVLPLIVKPEEWKVSAENLRNAVNFLVPFDLEYESRNNYTDDNL